MKINKLNDEQIVCELSETELNSMDLYINTLMDDKEKSKAFINALIDVALEHSNMINEKRRAIMDLSYDKNKKKLIAFIDTSVDTLMPEDIINEMVALLEDIESKQYTDDLNETDSELTNSEEGEDDEEEDDDEENKSFLYENEDYLTYKRNLEKIASSVDYSGFVYMVFKTIDEISETLKQYKNSFGGKSLLLKKDNKYLLVLSFGENSEKECNEFAYAISDFSKPENTTLARIAYMKEHYEIIIKEDAFQKLRLL